MGRHKKVRHEFNKFGIVGVVREKFEKFSNEFYRLMEGGCRD